MKLATTTLVFCVAALLALGLVILYSASMMQGPSRLVAQLMWCGIGLILGTLAAASDYRQLRYLSWFLLVASLVLLVLVLIPGIGLKIKGARRWLDLGIGNLQPSEIAKLSLVIALAHYGERYQRHIGTLVRGVIIPGLVISLFLALIFVEPDRGSTILLGAIAAAMLLIAGVRWCYLLPPFAAMLAGLAYSIWQDPMRLRRIVSWMNLEETKEAGGYQAYQAMLALGSGGWTGLGLGSGRQKFGFVPEHHTDFILSIIGEELGLVATLAVVLAFMVVVACGIYIARRANDTFGFLLASGLTLLIAFQAFINIGVVTSALPNKGMPLPFISYGGSNLVVMLVSVGLLISIARHSLEITTPARTRESELPDTQSE